MLSLEYSSLEGLMPVLKSGNPLSRIEFDQRHRWMPEVKNGLSVNEVTGGNYVAGTSGFSQGTVVIAINNGDFNSQL